MNNVLNASQKLYLWSPAVYTMNIQQFKICDKAAPGRSLRYSNVGLLIRQLSHPYRMSEAGLRTNDPEEPAIQKPLRFHQFPLGVMN